MSARHTSAFTLIEILVTLTIVGILFAFGYASFRDFARRQQLAGTVKQLQGDLRLAQQMALSGEKPPDGSCSTLDGIRFGIIPPSEYRIRAQCNGSSTGGYTYKTVNLTGDLVITPDATVNPILFKVLGQGTNILSSEAVITLTQTATGNATTITVTPGGEIK